MINKPIIGITVDYLNDDESNKYSNYPWYALRQHYSSYVSKSGGIPIFLPFESYSDNLEDIISLIDGALIPGGDFDVPPGMYGEQLKFDTRPAYERAKHEQEFMKKAMSINMPILGICHGMQLLNVMMKGTLFQSINEQLGSDINHKNKMRDQAIHKITIARDSILGGVFGCNEAWVNSNHRQSVNKLGEGLIASAICPDDGVVEAIESTRHDFVIGVEWHPEIGASKEIDDKLFNAFINAAKAYASKTC